MGTITNVPEHGGPYLEASSVAANIPIAATTLSASTSFVSDGNWGVQAKLGKAGQGGKIDLARGDTGAFSAYVGRPSPTSVAMDLAGEGFVRLFSNGLECLYGYNNNGVVVVGIGGAPITARLSLPAGAAGAGRAPLKFTSGPLNTTAEAGAVEFLTNDLYYTGTDLARRRLAVNGDVVALKAFTVATLPAGTVGDRAYVTDATTPTYNGALVGGGTVHVPVFRNATGWVSA